MAGRRVRYPTHRKPSFRSVRASVCYDRLHAYRSSQPHGWKHDTGRRHRAHTPSVHLHLRDPPRPPQQHEHDLPSYATGGATSATSWTIVRNFVHSRPNVRAQAEPSPCHLPIPYSSPPLYSRIALCGRIGLFNQPRRNRYCLHGIVWIRFSAGWKSSHRLHRPLRQ